jgi:hypothetical protein
MRNTDPKMPAHSERRRNHQRTHRHVAPSLDGPLVCAFRFQERLRVALMETEYPFFIPTWNSSHSAGRVWIWPPHLTREHVRPNTLRKTERGHLRRAKPLRHHMRRKRGNLSKVLSQENELR